MTKDLKKIIFGREGEQIAAEFLQKQGYKIIAGNFHTPYGEIDIIARDARQLVFVEIKTRSSDRFGSPQAAVTKSKLQKIIKSAHIYMSAYGKQSFRIDVVAITFPETGDYKIEHLKNVSPYF